VARLVGDHLEQDKPELARPEHPPPAARSPPAAAAAETAVAGPVAEFEVEAARPETEPARPEERPAGATPVVALELALEPAPDLAADEIADVVTVGAATMLIFVHLDSFLDQSKIYL
jgi:hypothetical protein